MSMGSILVGHTPLGGEVRAGVDRGFIALVQGQSSAGKTRLANNILLRMMVAYGSRAQFAVVDPKQVGFLPFKERCHVYTEETQWLKLMEALCNEMLRRYSSMAEQGVSHFEVTERSPYILLVIDEMSAVSNNQRLLKKERERFASLLVTYSNQCRQAGMGLLILCQSCDSTVLPTVVRSNCSTRLAMRTAGQEQVKMISAGREEECPCDLLTLPGEFYALTTETDGRWVRGRTWSLSDSEERSIIERCAQDKRTPYCLDWDNPAFRG